MRESFAKSEIQPTWSGVPTYRAGRAFIEIVEKLFFQAFLYGG